MLVHWTTETWGTYQAEDGTLTDYTIEISTNSTDGTDGTWSEVVEVTDNVYGAREHSFDFAGSSWIRLSISGWNKGNGWSYGALRDSDIHGASQGTDDTLPPSSTPAAPRFWRKSLGPRLPTSMGASQGTTSRYASSRQSMRFSPDRTSTPTS